MGNTEKMQLFGNQKIRSAWNEDEEKWYFSIVDVCWILTDQPNLQRARNYWKVLKTRLLAEGNETVTKCNQLKLVSPLDGKKYNTDVADLEQLFRIIQSIPSPKAEPFKMWLAQVGSERIDEITDPERAVQSQKKAEPWREMPEKILSNDLYIPSFPNQTHPINLHLR